MSTPAGFTALTANRIQDAAGNLLTGTLNVLPTDGTDVPIGTTSGGLGGPIASVFAPISFTNGVLAATACVPDVSVTRNQYISYRFVFRDATGRPFLTWKGVQPTGASLNLDTYVPYLPAQAPFTRGEQGLPGSGANFVPRVAAITGGTTTYGNIGTNFYDYTQETIGYYVNTLDGTLIYDSSGSTETYSSGYLDVRGLIAAGYTHLYMDFSIVGFVGTLPSGAAFGIGLAGYDANKAYLSGDATGYVYPNPFPIPAGASYIRVSGAGAGASDSTPRTLREVSTSLSLIQSAFVPYTAPTPTVVGGNTLVLDCSLSNVQEVHLANDQFWSASQVSIINSFVGQEITFRIFFSANGNCGFSFPSAFVNGRTTFAPGDGIVSPYGVVAYKWSDLGTAWIPTRDAGAALAGSTSSSSSGAAQSTRFRIASQLPGVVLDCDLADGAKIGGGTPTDNTAIINGYLAPNTSTNPLKLILDGPSACSGIVLPASPYFELEGIGPGSGLWINSGSNNSVLTNRQGGPTEPLTSPPAQAGYVILRNFRIEGNRGNGTTGNSNTGQPRGQNNYFQPTGYYYINIDLCNLEKVVIENVDSRNSALYALRLMNCSDVFVSNLKVLNTYGPNDYNGDGLHLSGPISKVRCVGANVYTNSDDALALNAPEGYGGNISDVEFAGGSWTGYSIARVYAGNFRVSGVRHSNISGLGFFCAFFVGIQENLFGVPNGGAVVANQIEDWSVDNAVIYMSATTQCGDVLCNSFGLLRRVGIRWMNPTGALCWAAFANQNLQGGEYTLGLTVCRSSSGNAAAGILIDTTANVGTGSTTNIALSRFVVEHWSMEDEPGSNYASVAYLFKIGTGSTIDDLFIKSIDSTKLMALVDGTYGWTNIVKVNGPGVLTCGFQIPDAKIALNCPYISDGSGGGTAGKMCIKHVAGTVTVLG